jgi:anti-anti-sigma factor
MNAPRFSAVVTRSDALSKVTCTGELDLAVADRFRRAVDEALVGEPRRVHLDCSAITFIDSIGMRALMYTATRFRDLGAIMTIEMSAPMRRVFDTVGVTCLFNVGPDPAPAAAGSDAVPASA